MSFETLGLAPALLRALAENNYNTPTPIQAEAIPLVLAGHDVLGGAQTGTGKTAAFALPVLTHASRARWCWCRPANWRCRLPKASRPTAGISSST
jgi:ATP-dependent RNA helicase RhlE